jgi:hypothetical protein
MYAVMSRNKGCCKRRSLWICSALIATQLCRISESTHNNRGSGFFCGSALRLYNKDLTQLELEMTSRVGSYRRRIESSSGVPNGQLIEN